MWVNIDLWIYVVRGRWRHLPICSLYHHDQVLHTRSNPSKIISICSHHNVCTHLHSLLGLAAWCIARFGSFIYFSSPLCFSPLSCRCGDLCNEDLSGWRWRWKLSQKQAGTWPSISRSVKLAFIALFMCAFIDFI